MSNTDTFNQALRSDIRENGLTLENAADKAKVSIRQFHRHIRGETKQGIMPLETAAELRKEGVMSRETAERYIEVIKTVIRLKKKKGRGNRRTLTIKNLLHR